MVSYIMAYELVSHQSRKLDSVNCNLNSFGYKFINSNIYEFDYVMCISNLTLINKYLGIIYAIVIMPFFYFTLIRKYTRVIFTYFCIFSFVTKKIIYNIRIFYSMDNKIKLWC